MGVDGYTFFNRDPIQVKRSDKVGRPVIDGFQTAMAREATDRGVVVAFSFSKDAHEEVARAKAEQGLEIQLLTVRELLRGRGDLRTPDLGEMFPERRMSFLDLPLPKVRSKRQRPKPEELVKSDRRDSGVQDADLVAVG